MTEPERPFRRRTRAGEGARGSAMMAPLGDRGGAEKRFPAAVLPSALR